MELSEWHSRSLKPDFNGVYECRNLSKPDSAHTYCLYKNGWHVDCETIEAAYRSTEKFRHNSVFKGTPKVIIFGLEVEERPILQWRGLANKPRGLKIEASDKWTYI